MTTICREPDRFDKLCRLDWPHSGISHNGEGATSMTSTQTHTPKTLAIRHGELSALYITVIDPPNMAKIASVYVEGIAAELVRRWNAHEAMLEALEAVVANGDPMRQYEDPPYVVDGGVMRNAVAVIAAAKGGGG